MINYTGRRDQNAWASHRIFLGRNHAPCLSFFLFRGVFKQTRWTSLLFITQDYTFTGPPNRGNAKKKSVWGGRKRTDLQHARLMFPLVPCTRDKANHDRRGGEGEYTSKGQKFCVCAASSKQATLIDCVQDKADRLLAWWFMNYLIQCFAFVFHQLRRVRINRSLVVRENKSRQFFLRWSLLSLCKTFFLSFFFPH